MCRLQFYRNIQKKSTNPSIRTLVSTLQCRFLCVFRILPYAHSANACGLFCIKATEKLFARIVKARIDCVEIFAVHILLDHPQRFTETLEVDDLTLS